MEKYLHLFDSTVEFSKNYYGLNYREPWVSFTEESGRVNYNMDKEDKRLWTPLTFDFLEDYSISFYDTLGTYRLQYRKNDGNWIEDSTLSVSGVAGDRVQVSCINPVSTYTILGVSAHFNRGVGRFNLSGNLCSLLDAENYGSITTLRAPDTFREFFSGMNVVDASNLILPATTLTNGCYRSMFSACPFLTTAPELPATTLANSCYYGMFWGCTSITTAPELPAATLASNCYASMFSGCTSINYVKCLATDISAESCTDYWVDSVASSGTFVAHDANVPWDTGDNGIPSGWSVQYENL